MTLAPFQSGAAGSANGGRQRQNGESASIYGRAPTSQILQNLLLQSRSEKVTLDWLLQHLGRRSFGIVLLLLGLLALIPGISTVGSVLIVFPAYQMIRAHEGPVFPRFLRYRTFRKGSLGAVLARTVPALRLMEKFVRPRWHTPFETTKRIVGCAILLVGALLFVPIPLSNVPPALTIMLLAFAYLEEDGVLLAATLFVMLVLLLAAAWLGWRAGAGRWL